MISLMISVSVMTSDPQSRESRDSHGDRIEPLLGLPDDCRCCLIHVLKSLRTLRALMFSKRFQFPSLMDSFKFRLRKIAKRAPTYEGTVSFSVQVLRKCGSSFQHRPGQ